LQIVEEGNKRYVTAVILGLVLSGLITLAIPGFSPLGLGAMWLLAFAISCVTVALLVRRIYGRSHWGMVMFGQALGCTAVAFLFISSI
jgi:asparagine N-glycosylation enzyme membrane subunit Stt3